MLEWMKTIVSDCTWKIVWNESQTHTREKTLNWLHHLQDSFMERLLKWTQYDKMPHMQEQYSKLNF